MPRYVWRDGHWVERGTGERMVPEGAKWEPVAPVAVIGDIPAYQSPVTGEVIGGRRQKRDDLARHNCVDAGDLPSPTGGKFRSEAFARKHGMPMHLVKERGE